MNEREYELATLVNTLQYNISKLVEENSKLREDIREDLREGLTREEISYGFITNDADLDAESYWAGVKLAEKMHGIGCAPLSNEQKRLEAIAIKQREAHGFGVAYE